MYAEQDILTGIDQMRHKIERLETKVDEIHAILERHNGSVSLRSRLDQGTVFTLRLPTS